MRNIKYNSETGKVVKGLLLTKDFLLPNIALRLTLSTKMEWYLSQGTTKSAVRFVWPAKTLIRLRIHAVWSVFTDRMCFLQPLVYPKSDKREPLSYWVDVLADLSLCWSERPFWKFCCALARLSHFFMKIYVVGTHLKVISDVYPQHLFINHGEIQQIIWIAFLSSATSLYLEFSTRTISKEWNTVYKPVFYIYFKIKG